jgi:predicted naringenin-chalcone synthase
MSSPTVWFVMDEIGRKVVAPGDWCAMIAYGAGMSAHAYLLQKGP